MAERGQLPFAKLQVLITIVIILALGVIIVHAVDVDGVDRSVAESRAYCYQTFGDSSLVNARAMFGHGGLHCAANDGDQPHLHEVSEWEKEKAYRVNESGSDKNWSAVQDDVIDPFEDKAWFETGFWPVLLVVVGITLPMWVMAVILAIVKNRLGK